MKKPNANPALVPFVIVENMMRLILEIGVRCDCKMTCLEWRRLTLDAYKVGEIERSTLAL